MARVPYCGSVIDVIVQNKTLRFHIIILQIVFARCVVTARHTVLMCILHAVHVTVRETSAAHSLVPLSAVLVRVLEAI